MRVDGTAAASQLHTPSASPAEDSSRDEFLRLLVAQLENQNPLEPQSGAEFVAQLAQFAAVEQGAVANDRLSTIAAEQASASNAAMAGFVGKTATVSAGSLQIDGPGAVPDLSVEVDDAAAKVKVVVTDQAGNEVRTIDIGAQAEGDVSVPWDGTDSRGIPVEEGAYTLTVQAEAKDGTSITGRVTMNGVIDALSFEGGLPLMRIGSTLR